MENQSPLKLSLLTVCLNSEKTIAHTINSVFEQSYENIEYIICDGGSTDETLNIIKSFGDKIILNTESDNGIFDAMNKGIRIASGDVIGILNSDDFYSHKDVLSTVMKVFDDQSIDSTYGDLHYVESDNTNKIYRNWKSGEFNPTRFHFGWMPPHPTFFVRKKIYEKYGLFDPSFKFAGDYELEIRFLYKYKISCVYLPEVLVKMRNNGNSNGSISKRLEAHKEDRLAWEKNGIRPPIYTIPLKPIRKLIQYIGPKFNNGFNKLRQA